MTAPPGPPVGAADLLGDLNPAQREAVEAVSGPVVILAGAGTGKTRVLTRRVAYAAATGAIDPRRALVVTFTTKAASEMAQRLAALGVRGATARTFHAAALDQLRYFWPRVSDTGFPGILESKIRLLIPLVAREPAPFRFTPGKDVADAIEWAKIRRVEPRDLAREALAAGRSLPLPEDVLRRIWTAYERAKGRVCVIDFGGLKNMPATLNRILTVNDPASLGGTVSGTGSNYILDLYLFGGLFAVYAGSALFGFSCRRFVGWIGKRSLFSGIWAECLTRALFAPRGDLGYVFERIPSLVLATFLVVLIVAAGSLLQSEYAANPLAGTPVLEESS